MNSTGGNNSIATSGHASHSAPKLALSPSSGFAITSVKIPKSAPGMANHSTHESIHKVPFYPPSTQMSSKSTNKKSIAENNLVPYDNERTTLYSTWTPLSDEKSNLKVSLFYLILNFLPRQYFILSTSTIKSKTNI